MTCLGKESIDKDRCDLSRVKSYDSPSVKVLHRSDQKILIKLVSQFFSFLNFFISAREGAVYTVQDSHDSADHSEGERLEVNTKSP